jgi:voltage-gated potassium channel Kch
VSAAAGHPAAAPPMSRSLRARLAEPWAHERSLTAMLIFLVINVVVVYPLSAAGLAGHLLFGIIFGLLLVTGIAATARHTAVLVAFSSIAVLASAVHWVRYVDPTPALQLADIAASMVSCTLLTVILCLQVFREGEVRSARVQGAVAIYLLLAMIWAFGYALIAALDPSAFQETIAVPPNESDTHRYMYFSFVTLTTLGLGDIVPLSPLARLLVILESMIGQLFPVILIARLVSLELYYRQRRFEQQQAALDRKALTREIAHELQALREEKK